MNTSIPQTYYPLTSTQREIWFDQVIHEGIPLYNIGGFVKIPGPIDPVLFEQAINLLIQKHDALRIVLTVAKDQDGLPLQTVVETLPVFVPVQDFSGKEDAEPAALNWMRTRFDEPFELLGKPLFRYDLVKTNDDCYYWLMQYHHIIVDGYSVALLNRSLAAIYTQRAKGQTPELNGVSYVHFIEHDQAYLTSEELKKNRQYWANKYPAAPEPLLNPRYRAQFNSHVVESNSQTLTGSRDFYQRLQAFAQSHHTTLFRVLLAVLYVYFTRTGQRDDFTIGYATLNRTHRNFQQIAGLFTLITPGHFQFGQELNFTELLEKLHHRIKADIAHPYPLSEINKAFNHGEQRTALFDISISYQRFDYDSQFNGLSTQTNWLLHSWEQNPLMIYMQDFHVQTDVKLDFVYNLAYFTPIEIQALQNRFMTIVQAVLAEPAISIRHLPILTEQEIYQLQTWNQTQTDYPQDQTIVSLFERQVTQTPDNIAVVFEGEQLSYRLLNDKANQLAHKLLAHLALKDTYNPLIAICVGRSLEMVVGLLGILKAGGAYVPIDPNYPAERINHMLRDSAVSLMLTQSRLQAQLPVVLTEIMCLDEMDWTVQSTENLVLPSQPNDLAYVIYTSGSTGQPKGVMIEHHSLNHLIHWHLRAFAIQSHDKATLFANNAFDASVWELWPYLAAGACVYPSDSTLLSSTARLVNWFNQHQITVSFLPTSIIDNWHSSSTIPVLMPLRLLLTGGDTLHQCPEHLPCTLVNNYGPTENTVVTTSTPVTPNNKPTIGKPIDDVSVFILDKHHQILPPGIPGELCVAGEGLARGYLNRPELTAEKFIEVEIFGKPERIYKTGDLARWLPDGNIEFLGRIDNQVKLRGFRIELGEIEAVLLQHDAVKDTAVIVQQTDNNKRLIAYVTANSQQLIVNSEQSAVSSQLVIDNGSLITELHNWLKSRLPDYMVPAFLQVLDALPLTPNRKIDRNALEKCAAEKNFALETVSYVVPRSIEEELLASIWIDVLGVERVGIHDNFFELGGHSLLATQVMSRIREIFDVELAMRTLFEKPKLAALAEAIKISEGDAQLPPILVQAEDEAKVLSFGQEWFWLLSQYDSQSWVHNMSYAWQLSGTLEVDILRRVACDLVEHHQSLRLCFPESQGQVTAKVLPAYDPLTVSDLSHLTAVERAQQLKTEALQQSRHCFDLKTGPLFKLHLVQLAEQRYILFMTVHHIIFDGWSANLLLAEFQQRYIAYHQQQVRHWPVPEIQYTDFAAWQRACLQGNLLKNQLDYWVNQLQDAPELLKLPTDYPRPEIQKNKGSIVNLLLPKAHLTQLNRLARQHNCSLQMVLFSTFVLLLHRYSGQNDICVGVPRMMRHQRQTENMIGLFLNILVLRTQISPQAHFIELLQQVRQQALEAYAHQDIPFEYLITHLRPQRSTAYNPYFQVMFNLVNVPDSGQLTLPQLEMQPWSSEDDERATSNLDIVFTLEERTTGLAGSILFDKALFKTETIEYWREGFQHLLEQVVQQADAPLTRFVLSPRSTPRYPLTSSQREIWFDQLLHDDIPLYNIGGHVHIPGPLDPQLFKQAVNLLVQKHDTLRTLLLNERDEEGIPLQTYAESLNVDVPVHDFSNAENSERAALEWMPTRFKEAFELIEQPLFRYDLVKTSDESYYWLMQYHHLIADGWTLALLNRSLGEIYTQLVNGENPDLSSPSYTAYIDSDRNYVESDVFKKQRQYWLEKYRNVPEPLLNPRYRAQFDNDLIGSACEELYLSRDFYAQLNTLAKLHQTTLFHVLLGALYVYFTRTAQRDDFAIGLPVLNRANAQFKQTAGLFTGVSATWFNYGQELSFAELLEQIQKTLKANYRHQRFPISEVKRAVGLKYNHSTLFDINLSYESHNYDASFNDIDSHCTLMLHPWEQSPLMIFVRDFHTQADVKFDFVYNLAYFTKADIQALQNRFVMILQRVLLESTVPIHELPILTAPEVQQLQTWNQTQTDYPQDQTIVTLFEQQVTQTPDNLAVVFKDEQLTYQQLNEKSNQLAHKLLSHPVLKDVHNPLIAICVERSLDMLIGLLGILKAGGAYVPIDLNYPTERIAYLLNDSAAAVLLTQSGLQAQLPVTQTIIICLDETDYTTQSSHNLEQSSQPHDLAYIIYTSGSTGTPKGVMVEHHALILHIHAMQHTYTIRAPDRVLQFTSMGFDTSLEQVLVTWLSGAGLIPVKSNVISAHDLLNLMQSQKISIADLPPAYWQQMLDINTRQATLPNLHTLILGGEALPWELAQHTRDSFPNLNCFNAYGPTEAVITPTLYRFPTTLTNRHAYVSIGQPRANTQIFVLDNYQQLQPIGIPGELYIAGDGLARGYLNRPELTAEKFIETNLLGTTQRLYKTGDRVRWLPNGNLEFLGRLDDQIKLRGFRIELGEIENMLTQHKYVKEAVVIRYEGSSNKTLAAYVTMAYEKLAIENDQLVMELRDYLKNGLPDYMLPASFTVLDKLPLTLNGKIDRKVLEQLSVNSQQFLREDFIAPRTPEEELLAGIWSSVLDIDKIGIHDNFFELGGHSLQAVQLISKIALATNVDIPVKQLFLYPTIVQLATLLTKSIPQRNSIEPSHSTSQLENHPISAGELIVSQSSSYFQLERRSLLSLLLTKKIQPVNAAALGYLPNIILEQTDLSREEILEQWFDNLPIVSSIIETAWGRIAGLLLPRFDSELYGDTDDIVDVTLDALEIAGQIGATIVSLTGIIPSATDYGRAIVKGMADRDLPQITTGHSTTSATVVLAIQKILQEGGREIPKERVGVIGLGSIGFSSLCLMLKCLPHPVELMLCDLYHKKAFLEDIRSQLVSELGFHGKIQLLFSEIGLPDEIYNATLIVGATNVPDVLDINKLQSGTLIVDDSGPHCFKSELAIKRFQEHQDILFTEGGVLKSPQPLNEMMYFPHYWEKNFSSNLIEKFVKHNPFEITGCIFSSVLSSYKKLKPTVGLIQLDDSVKHYEILLSMGFQAADLHCENYVLPDEAISHFRERFGH